MSKIDSRGKRARTIATAALGSAMSIFWHVLSAAAIRLGAELKRGCLGSPNCMPLSWGMERAERRSVHE